MHQHRHDVHWKLHALRGKISYVHLLAGLLIGLELSQEFLTAVLFENLKVVIGHLDGLWAGINYLA